MPGGLRAGGRGGGGSGDLPSPALEGAVPVGIPAAAPSRDLSAGPAQLDGITAPRNQTGDRTDNCSVRCSSYREALSAWIDGEPHRVQRADVVEHLVACGGCRRWHDDVVRLNRLLRVRPTIAVPDLTSSVLAAALPASRGWTARLLLGGVSVVQLTLGVSQVIGGRSAHGVHGDAGASHLFNESTAWNLALGIALAWAALRPSAAAGLLSPLSAFLAVLVPFCVHDLVVGAVTFARVGSHLVLLAGLALLITVHFGQEGPGWRATVLPTSTVPEAADDESLFPERGSRNRGRHLRPVSKRRAA